MSISQRLFIALFGLAVVVIAVSIGLSRWSFQQGFLDYVNAFEQTRLERLGESLSESFRRSPSDWKQNAAKILDAGAASWEPPDHPPPPHFAPDRPSARPPPPPPPGHGRPPPARPNHPPTAFYDDSGKFVAGDVEIERTADVSTAQVSVDGMVIGELRSVPPRAFTSPQQTRVLREQQSTTIGIGLFMLLAAALLSYVLSRTLLAPIQQVVGGVRALSAGDYGSRLRHARKDELGALADDVNRLAQTLDASAQAQRKWIASISHELRTPVAVLVGEIQALKDGIRAFTPEQLQSFDSEVERLRRLIDDLYQLSLTEVGALRYQMKPADLVTIVSAAVARHRVLAKDTEIRVDASMASARVLGDDVRLGQLCDNLLSNAVAYTDVPGTISVAVQQSAEGITLIVDDSPPAVPAADLERIFEALYRRESSRDRKAGGAGLGLAICKNIVDAHHGEITASTSPLGGLRIRVVLPSTPKTTP